MTQAFVFLRMGRHRDSQCLLGAAMAWVYLIAAGLFEVGWPIGLKWAQDPRKLIVGMVMAVGCLIVSGVLLYLAQREIALGTAYAVWTGIGAAGTFLLGVWAFGDPGSLGRYLAVALIITGVVGLKLAH
jgi:quaternary ammonium compound-resistance protein SugE